MSQNKLAESILKNIRTRRNIKEFKNTEIPSDFLKLILEAATWAPNHRHTEPWRFVVLEKNSAGRQIIAEAVADWTLKNVKNPTPERRIKSAEVARSDILLAPSLIYVFSIVDSDEEISNENYAATSCAVQNLQLAAHALGLGVGWSTGRSCKPEVVKYVIDMANREQEPLLIVGALTIGYPRTIPIAKRTSISSVTTWVNK